MPDCNTCAYLAGSTYTALPKEWPVIPVNLVRASVVAICQEYSRLIAPGMRVLEIGCGTWSLIRQHCQRFEARWEGIDANESATEGCWPQAWGSLVPLPGSARAAIERVTFVLLFRWLVLRDRDPLRLAHRLIGTRARFLSRLLPPAAPLLNT